MTMNVRARRTLLPALIASLVWSASGRAPAQTGEVEAPASPEIRVENRPPYGPHLVDRLGRALYRFSADRRAQDGATPESRCDGVCLAKWPPIVTAAPPRTGAEAQAALIGSFERDQGVQQVTYDGWPLYYYADDKDGRILGQGLRDSGGDWYLVRPDGSLVKAEP